MSPSNGKNASFDISPAMKGLIPNAMARIRRCFFLSIKKRFLPLLIFSVSVIVLKAIMKHKTSTTIFAMLSNFGMKVPPSNPPRK